MWKDLDKEYVQYSWENSKRKIDFMRKINITNRDYRACERAIKFFNLSIEDFGKQLRTASTVDRKKLSGKFFGELEVLCVNEKKSSLYQRTYYDCYCHKCGNIVQKRTDYLKNGIKDCGCEVRLTKRIDSSVDLVNKVFNYLKVLEMDTEKTSSKEKDIYWKCECLRCGNIISVKSSYLKNGNTKSCGCLVHDKSRELRGIDISDQIFGYLQAIEIDENETKARRTSSGGHLWWKCKCLKCGRVVSKNSYDLRKGYVNSCGCTKRSRGETLIENFLKSKNFIYATEVTFPELKDKGCLRFDFVIYTNKNKVFAAIEFQGKQHYSPVEYFGGQQELLKLQHRDAIKRDFCKTNNIKLIEISYKDIENINLILRESLKGDDLMPNGDVQ